MIVLYDLYDYGLLERNGLVEDVKTAEVVCYSVAMHISYDGKYTKMYAFLHHMHP
jgi:hypothetical protein